MKESDGCSRCGECCRWLAFRCWHGGLKWAEFYEKRGCKIVYDDIDPSKPIGMLVPSACSHLRYRHIDIKDPGKGFEWYCDIYKTRPALCRMPPGQPDGKMFYRHEGCTR